MNATITTQALEPQTNSQPSRPALSLNERRHATHGCDQSIRHLSIDLGRRRGCRCDSRQGHAEVQAIGASAVNQAVKAIAIAHGYLVLDNIDIVCVPSFTEVTIDGQERTAVRISVEKR